MNYSNAQTHTLTTVFKDMIHIVLILSLKSVQNLPFKNVLMMLQTYAETDQNLNVSLMIAIEDVFFRQMINVQISSQGSAEH